MIREILLALTLLAQTVGSGQGDFIADEVVLVPDPGVTWKAAGRTYAGPIRVREGGGHLGVVEEVDLDTYLLGIREVPFSWEEEALAAQAVAARTYLAWTLQRGRSSNGRRYGYDICATSACQVYAGLDGVRGKDGDRWKQAVESTSGEILVYEGAPAQALYSSTTGGRTRSAEDVFLTSPVPYLVAVDSPDEPSPFVSWRFVLDQERMSLLLQTAGVAEGMVSRIETEVRSDGEGPWMVTIVSDAGTVTEPTWQLRGKLNRAAREVMPDVLPARRPGGKRYPQSFMSPSYRIMTGRRFVSPVDGSPPSFETIFIVTGRGWGHLVGMSQYGAEAMARAGADHTEILAHYYGGLTPQTVEELLPGSVSVGLAAGVDEAEVKPDGPVTVVVEGETVAQGVLGTWRFESTGRFVRAIPPRGFGLPPSVQDVVVDVDEVGRPRWVVGAVTTAAEVRVRIDLHGYPYSAGSWELIDAGLVGFDISDLIPPRSSVGLMRVVIEARSPLGAAEGSFAVLPGAS